MDGHCQLRTMGHRCTPCHAHSRHLLPSTDDAQASTSRSHSVCFPASRPIGSGRVCYHAAGQSEHAGIPEDKHAHPVSWTHSLRFGLRGGAGHVGLWPCLALLRACLHQPIKISIQYGLVGIHISPRRLYGCHYYFWQRNAFKVFQRAWDGTWCL